MREHHRKARRRADFSDHRRDRVRRSRLRSPPRPPCLFSRIRDSFSTSGVARALASGCRPAARSEGWPMSPYQAWYGSNVWSVVYLPEAEADLRRPAGSRAGSGTERGREAEVPWTETPLSPLEQGAGCPGSARAAPAGRAILLARFVPIGDTFVIAAVGRDAKADSGGFELACGRATQRLAKVEDD